MKRMNCKLQIDDKDCGVLIDYDADTKTATEVSTGQKHIHTKKKSWTDPKFKNVETELENTAKIAHLEIALNEEIEERKRLSKSLQELWEAFSKQSFETGAGAKLK